MATHNHSLDPRRSEPCYSLDELASGVAHEINNPLNGIINYAQILVNQLPRETQGHDLANRIIREGERIAGIIQSLFTLSGAVHRHRETLSAVELLTDSLNLTRSQLKTDGIRLEVTTDNSIPNIYGNRQQLMQVFLNLISNARQALNEKFPSAHKCKLLRIAIDTNCRETTSYVRVEFHDQGSGIPRELMKRILIPFVTTRTAGSGAGLDLSSSLSILQQHNGSLNIQSVEGFSTTVTVELPMESSLAAKPC